MDCSFMKMFSIIQHMQHVTVTRTKYKKNRDNLFITKEVEELEWLTLPEREEYKWEAAVIPELSSCMRRMQEHGGNLRVFHNPKLCFISWPFR